VSADAHEDAADIRSVRDEHDDKQRDRIEAEKGEQCAEPVELGDPACLRGGRKRAK
jgi:hypothetical protein